MTSEVQEALLRHQTQLFKLQNIAALTPEEKQDILEASDEDYLDDLAAIQRDQLTVQVLQKMLLTSTQEVMSALCKCIVEREGACVHNFFSSG
jgi:nuclear pore complex protein Nup205